MNKKSTKELDDYIRQQHPDIREQLKKVILKNRKRYDKEKE